MTKLPHITVTLKKVVTQIVAIAMRSASGVSVPLPAIPSVKVLDPGNGSRLRTD